MAQVVSPLGFIQTGRDLVVGTSDAAVTQGTSATTTVVLNALAGRVTLFEVKEAKSVHSSFTITDARVKSTSVILLSLVYATAGAGEPFARLSSVADGSFVVSICNGSTAAACDQATGVLHYLVIN